MVRTLVLFAGATFLAAALQTYSDARSRYDRDSIQAMSTGCLERRPCPAPQLDILPTIILAALGILLVGMSVHQILGALQSTTDANSATNRLARLEAMQCPDSEAV